MRVVGFIAVLALSCGGCAQTVKSVEVTKLRQRVEALAQRAESDRQQIDELQTRLFLLEDRVDTEATTRERTRRPPRHPTIRIRPGDNDNAADTAPAAAPRKSSNAPAGGGSSVVAVDTVEYAGAARRPGPRPLLRLNGDGRPTRSVSISKRNGAAELTGLDPSLVADKIPVLPLPKRRASLSIANADGGLKEYRAALRLYRKGDYRKAITTFRSFLGGRTNHPYADNALYWLGECYYATKQYADAVASFRRVVNRYPEGNKVPDAMLKLGFSQIKQGATADAKAVLKQVRESFPSSNAAKLAGETLATIK